MSAVPGLLGYRTLQAVLDAGKNVVDIAFFPENPLALDDLARSKRVTAIVDCGVAPGMSNLLVAHAASQPARVDRVRTVAIANGTLAAAVGLGLQLWLPGIALWITGHTLAVWGARLDSQFMAVFARHIKHRVLLDV